MINGLNKIEGVFTPLPMGAFYKAPGMGKNHARIAYVLEVPEMEKALRILEEGLKVYPGRTI